MGIADLQRGAQRRERFRVPGGVRGRFAADPPGAESDFWES